MSLSLLAIGDVHFDSPSLLGTDERKKIEGLKQEAFKKAVDEAIERNVSAFFICGDLYDEQAVSFETLIFLRKCFLRLASCGIKVLYAHGMSDPDSAFNLIKTSNLVDFSHEVERFELISAEAVPEAIVFSAGFANNAALLIGQFEQKSSHLPTIGMMYEKDGLSHQGSFILDGISNLNYDLFILGGYHHYVIPRSESNILYLGSPTGTWFGDKTGGALYAEFGDDGRTTLDKIPLSDVSWHDVEIGNITETDMGTLKRKIEIEIQSAVENNKNAFVRVMLSGRSILAEKLDDNKLGKIGKELSETLGLSVYMQKEDFLPMLPKTLLDTTSPFVESVKIIDSIKNDDEKFESTIESVNKQNELFYSTLPPERIGEYQSGFRKGLLDTICKVMIKEAGNENQTADS